MLETEVAVATAVWKPRPLASIEFCDDAVKMRHRLIETVISCILPQLVLNAFLPLSLFHMPF